jgi:cytochrome c556
MRKASRLASLLLALAVGACRSQPPPSDLRTTATIEEIMESIVEPAADDIWNSVGTSIKPTGMEDRMPRTEEEWSKVRHDAIAVMEAMNLVMMAGRRAAAPGSRSEHPGIELDPQEIETLIGADRKTFVSLAHQLQDRAAEAVAAIDAKNTEALLDAGEKLDEACENCHKKYWYPNQ